MISDPKISVVVPCFNAAAYVGATLHSVFAQTGFQLDVVVVDDGSSDGSADVVAAAFPSVTVLRQPNRGAAVARNTGIEQARFEWVAFADADDIWLPGKLRAQWALLQSGRGARMAYTDVHLWPSADPEPSPQFIAELSALAADDSRWTVPSGWIYPQLLYNCEIATPTVLMHRSVLDEVGVFDPALTIGEDYDLWLRASRVTAILSVRAPMVLYRIHDSNITKRAPERNYKEQVIGRAVKRWGYWSPDGVRASKVGVRRHLCRSWIDFATAHLSAGSLATARRGAFRALCTDPAQTKAWKVLAKALTQSVTAPRRPTV